MTIKKSVKIERSPEVTFRLFTAEISSWWPLNEGYSYGHERKGSIHIELREGGRFYEKFIDGEEFVIGHVTKYAPPNVIVFTWNDKSWEAETEVEVRFLPDGPGTRLEVEHRGWEGGPRMREESKNYDPGWDFVLTRFIARASI